MKLKIAGLLAVITLLFWSLAAAPAQKNCRKNPEQCPTPTLTPQPTQPPDTTKPTSVVPQPNAPGATNTAPPPATLPVRTATPTRVAPGGSIPYPAAPACTNHSNSVFHTLWNSELGCHYDHEHGDNPFTAQVAQTFPGFDLPRLLGNAQIGHTNPSSPVENTDKHGGFKWNVQLVHPEGCAGFEGAATGVNASVVEYHAFGDYAIEAESRLHSTVALLRQCRTNNPNDYGYVFINQLQDYGQRIMPYQGTLIPYPNQPIPAFPSPRGPYLSIGCIDRVSPYVAQCRSSLAEAQRNNADSIWTSKPTGTGHSDTPGLFRLLFRVRDIFRLIDWSDQTYPFTFVWLCTADSGATFAPAGCRYTNSTTQVHEVAGDIPTTWDNLAGWDTDPRPGRVTVDGFVNDRGQPTAVCQAPGTTCYPIKLVNAFTGTYGSVLVFTGETKGTNVVPYLPSRNVWFCGGLVCAEGAPGAVPSGWIGPRN